MEGERMSGYKENKIYLSYDKRLKDFVVRYPSKPDGGFVLHHILGNILEYRHPSMSDNRGGLPYETTNFKEELERRGYDLSTLRFSIEKKKTDEIAG
jgi:hypothetical protein